MEYGLLGEKLSHSYSPMIHRCFADYEYELVEKAPCELGEFLENRDFKGLNVTIPYKKAVIPYLDELSDTAKKIGSVNTIVRRADGSLWGHNTDWGGLMYTFKYSKIDVSAKKALVLGSGGASLTAVAVLRDLGAESVTVISRSGEDNYENVYERHRDAQIIVNTTPVGMYPNNMESPVDLSRFDGLCGVVDIIFNPWRTALLLQAEELGIKCAGGLSMLVAQAALACESFVGGKFSQSDIERVRKKILRETKNLVLIGMPGCGKTTIGRRIARITGREFVDIDAMIAEKAGKSIPEIFAEDGEEAFRAIETECAAEAGKLSSAVISCGGGIVSRERNYKYLRQNGTIVFINRKTSALATRGRPVSQSRSLEDIAAERVPIYKKWASVEIENLGVGYTAGMIVSFLHLRKKHKK